MTSTSSSHQESQLDFTTMPEGLSNLKNMAGLAQMAFATGMLVINHYYLQEQIVILGCVGMFVFGFYLVGIKNQSTISPSKKWIKITRGFLFITFTQVYTPFDIDRIQVILKTHTGTDSNGIGPTQENTTIFTYYVQLVLKNGGRKTMLSGSDKAEMEAFAKRVSHALELQLSIGD